MKGGLYLIDRYFSKAEQRLHADTLSSNEMEALEGLIDIGKPNHLSGSTAPVAGLSTEAKPAHPQSETLLHLIIRNAEAIQKLHDILDQSLLSVKRTFSDANFTPIPELKLLVQAVFSL